MLKPCWRQAGSNIDAQAVDGKEIPQCAFWLPLGQWQFFSRRSEEQYVSGSGTSTRIDGGAHFSLTPKPGIQTCELPR